MWILADQGFISIVEHQDDMNVLQVRSRVREDISRIFPNADVYEHDGADYLYRANISREEVANVLWEKVMTLDYTSHVKDVALKRSAPAQGRSTAYYATWTAMSKMQPVPPYHKKSGTSGSWVEDDRYWSTHSTSSKTTTTTSKPSAGSLAMMGITVRPEPKPEAPAPVDTPVEVHDPVCQEAMTDPTAVCAFCHHTAIVHRGLNDVDGCILCEIDQAYFDYEETA